MQKLTLKTILVVASLACATTFAESARAEIPTGFFEGKVERLGQSIGIAQVFIQTVQVKGVPVSYGLLIKTDPEAAIFRIEELDDGTQVWIRLSKTAAGLIGSPINQDGDLTVQKVGNRLVMMPAKTSPCRQQFSEITVSSERGLEWAALHDGRFEERHLFGERFGVSVTFGNGGGVLSGKFRLADQLINGTYRMSEVIPGVATLRAQVLNPESPDGRSMERTITATVAMIKQSARGGDESLRFIQIGDASGCLDPMTQLNP